LTIDLPFRHRISKRSKWRARWYPNGMRSGVVALSREWLS